MFPLPPWRLIGCGMLCVAVVLGTAESFWRARGWRSTVPDSPALRVRELDLARTAGPDAVVLLGASRVCGFAPATFRSRFSSRALINLSISGTSEAAFIHELAESPFAGTILFSANESNFETDAVAAGRELLEEMESVPVSEYSLGGAWRSRWIGGRAELGWRQILVGLALHRELPKSNDWVTRDAERFTFYDFAALRDQGGFDGWRAALAEGWRTVCDAARDDSAWAANVRAFGAAAKVIEDRGGRVVLIRFPTSGFYQEGFDRAFPRERYWNRIGELTGLETIYWQDVPSLRGFVLPDDSHLDQRDAPAFTAALLDELERRGVL